MALLLGAALLSPVSAGAQTPNQVPIGKFNLTSINNGVNNPTPNVVVRGFALDPDSTDSVAIRVFRNGERLFSITANKPRPGIALKYGLGAEHGITTVVPLVAGENEICVEALDTDLTAPTGWLGCRTVLVSDVPLGHVDPLQMTNGANRSLIISGEIRDSEYNGRNAAHVYVDGIYMGATATTRRTQRFVMQMPIDPGSHRVCVWAIASPPQDLGCQTINVPNTTSTGSFLPIGSMHTTTEPGQIHVTGFAVDADTTESVRVRFEVNGATRGAIIARRINTTLHERFGRGDRHAYRITMRVPAGEHELCGFIEDADSDLEKELGCRTITVG